MADKNTVAVAPYWNVNRCKGKVALRDEQVAVAPYWNVNEIISDVSEIALKVAVAPYWNVNVFTVHRLESGLPGSSSTILECKLQMKDVKKNYDNA